MSTTTPPIDPKLLEILRCPVAVHYTDKGDDPGKLEIQREYWLVSADSGYKYPIIDGIPKMLIEEGAKWKDTSLEDLPVPPPNEAVYAVAEEALTPEMQSLAADLAARADETRAEVAKQLREAARHIREDADVDSGAGPGINDKANAIATGLDSAAELVEGHVPATPAALEKAAGVNWALVGLMFALGLVVGLLLRRGGNRG